MRKLPPTLINILPLALLLLVPVIGGLSAWHQGKPVAESVAFSSSLCLVVAALSAFGFVQGWDRAMGHWKRSIDDHRDTLAKWSADRKRLESTYRMIVSLGEHAGPDAEKAARDYVAFLEASFTGGTEASPEPEPPAGA